MIRLLSLAVAFVCFLVGAVFLVNALMVTFDTIFASRDALLVVAFWLAALLAVKAGESLQFAYDDWTTRKMQTALRLVSKQARVTGEALATFEGMDAFMEAGIFPRQFAANYDRPDEWRKDCEEVLKGVKSYGVSDTQELPRVG